MKFKFTFQIYCFDSSCLTGVRVDFLMPGNKGIETGIKDDCTNQLTKHRVRSQSCYSSENIRNLNYIGPRKS